MTVNMDTTKLADVPGIARNVLEEEARCVAAAAARLDDEFVRAVRLIVDGHGRCIVCGMGKSGLIARKISATLSSTGTPSFFLHPGEALHGDLGMVTDQDVVLLLSHSGETDEILRLIPFLRRLGAGIIALTGNPGSSLSKLADVTLNGAVEREACPLNLAPTSSTTVALALGDALAVSLLHLRGFRERDFARLHPSGSLGKRFITVRDLMHSGDSLPTASPDIPLKEAIACVSRGKLGVLFLVDPDDQSLAGILTDGDLRRYFERTTGAVHVPVREVMSGKPKQIGPERLAMEALRIMEDASITSLAVTENRRLVGALHLHDILKARII
jgi:arabinose-5-phosphate isomerase